MKWHKAEVKLSAKNAAVIRAALKQSVDAKKIASAYLDTQPVASDNPTMDRAKARAWAIMNVRFDNEALDKALKKTWAEGYVLGNAAAGSMLAAAQRKIKKEASLEESYDWDSWQAGDEAAALLIAPPPAFAEMLANSAIVIKSLDSTSLERIGSALSASIKLGLSPQRTAKAIAEHISDPARALTIAITETNRVVSAATMQRYLDAGLDQQQWITSDPCPTCQMNNNRIVQIGQAFPSGHSQPPAHPNCRCSLTPVIDGFDDPTAGSMTPLEPESASGYQSKPALGLPRTRKQIEQERLAYAQSPEALALKEKYEKIGFMPPENTMAAIHKYGYNGAPTLVDGQALDELVDDGWIEMFRGVRRNVDSVADDFLSDINVAGRGIYGNGHYFAPDSRTALVYTQTDVPDWAAYIANGGKKDNMLVFRAAINPNAKGASYALVDERQWYIRGLFNNKTSDDWARLTPDDIEALDTELQLLDASADEWFMAQGYDYYWIDMTGGDGKNMDYIVLLNKSAVAVQEII